jgi:hypothetical protein
LAALAISDILALKKPFLAKTLTAARIIFSCLSELLINNYRPKSIIQYGPLKQNKSEWLFI